MVIVHVYTSVGQLLVIFFRQIEAVRRIKGNECSCEIERIEEECVS